MSNTRHVDARLETFQGPIFPACIDELGRTLDGAGFYSEALLAEIGAAVPDFLCTDKYHTSDHYLWYCGIAIACDNGQIRILFPWTHDEDCADGTPRDRSLALYYRGLSPKEAEQVARNVFKAARARLAV